MFTENKVQYQPIKLPSKGLCYKKDSILSSGQIRLKYPTAFEQNILLSSKLLANGTAIDTFIQALCIDKFDIKQLLIGDKNAIIYASRILAYGAGYGVQITCPSCRNKNKHEFDLNQLSHKQINFQLLNQNNLYQYILPNSKKLVKFKLIDGHLSEQIQRKNKLMQKTGAKINNVMTIRLAQQIVQFDGITQYVKIKRQVQNMRSIDSLQLRKYISSITPDVITEVDYQCLSCGIESKIDLEITQQFFWPSDVV